MRDWQVDQLVLTGCGWVTPFAAGGIGEVLSAALQSGELPYQEGSYWPVSKDSGGRFPSLPPELTGDHGSWITGAALELARQSAALQDDRVRDDRCGIVLGCAVAGQAGMLGFATEVRRQSPRFVSPIHFPQTVGNYISGAIARGYHIRGPHSTIACGAASGLDAVVEAAGIVARGEADVVYAGGVSALLPELAEGLSVTSALPSEGACLFAVEAADHAAARNASVLATFIRTGHSREPESINYRGTARAEARGSDGVFSSDHGSDEPGGIECAINSSTSMKDRGAVSIAYWTGWYSGALGAAAIAAAIGAARGLAVPVVDGVENPTVRVLAPAADSSTSEKGVTLARVYAEASRGVTSFLELAVAGTP